MNDCKVITDMSQPLGKVATAWKSLKLCVRTKISLTHSELVEILLDLVLVEASQEEIQST